MIFKSSVGLIFVALRFNALFSRLVQCLRFHEILQTLLVRLLSLPKLEGVVQFIYVVREIRQYIEGIFVLISNKAPDDESVLYSGGYSPLIINSVLDRRESAP